MIIGRGLIASLFKENDYKNTIFFASGVSNSLEDNPQEFLREENLIKKTVEMMQKFGGKAADINMMVEEMQKTDSFGLWGQLKGFAFSIILYSIIGLITALIVRRERPQSI